ncbi:MAG: MucBP domain-containing protein [Lachnospiraceae bacterium]|jgi:hypothetical protein|nr:MucBP domain-containing protein [Lachnospiraceae bacterium]
MKMRNKILAGFLTLCLLTALNGRDCLASEAPPADSGTDHNTTYTITLYSGKQGTFTGAGDTGGQADSSGSRVVLKGLEYGSMITFHPQDMVELAADSKYYVKGIRQSGRDNGEAADVSSSALTVTEDRDYVVFYGIKGELVSYKVNYQDASGKQLAGSKTYYGNVGDKPVVAFLYLEGYEPQAYNLTKTLSANEAENIFTFVYTPVEASSPAGGASGGETVITEEETVVIAQDSGVTVLPGNGADSQETAGEQQDITGEEIPLEGPAELEDLDDDEVPMAGRDGIDSDQGSRLIHGAAIIGIAAAAGLVLLMVLLKKCMKKEKN